MKRKSGREVPRAGGCEGRLGGRNGVRGIKLMLIEELYGGNWCIKFAFY